MDPLSAAMSFATIVGLLSNFKTERSGTKLDDFIEWLKEKHHEDIARSITQNQSLSSQLQSVLALNHQELVQRLDSLDQVLSSVAAHVETFSSLATTIRPSSVLSEQAITVVKQFVASGAKEFWQTQYLGDTGPKFILMGVSGNLDVAEPRFIEDDLNTLVELGILRLKYGSNGTKQFVITRQAVALAESA